MGKVGYRHVGKESQWILGDQLVVVVRRQCAATWARPPHASQFDTERVRSNRWVAQSVHFAFAVPYGQLAGVEQCLSRMNGVFISELWTVAPDD